MKSFYKRKTDERPTDCNSSSNCYFNYFINRKTQEGSYVQRKAEILAPGTMKKHTVCCIQYVCSINRAGFLSCISAVVSLYFAVVNYAFNDHKQPKTDAYHRRTRRPTNTILSKPTKNQGSNFLSTTSQNLYALRSTRDSRTRKVISFVLQNHNKYWFVIFLLKMKTWRDTIELAFFWWSKMVLVEIFGLLNRKISRILWLNNRKLQEQKSFKSKTNIERTKT